MNIETNTVVLQADGAWWRLRGPLRVVCATQPDRVMAALQEVETAVAQHHLYGAGFLSYEAGAVEVMLG
ncbi:MAG: hypothetical protein IAE79_19925, partial [Anaerolinea sp.]|nr:hypothetical protein [Anaerolinea sp.]